MLRVLLPPSRRVQLHRYRIGRKAGDYGRTAIPSKGRAPRYRTTHRCDGRRQGPRQYTHALPSVRAVVTLVLSQAFIYPRIDTFIISYYMYELTSDHTFEFICKQYLIPAKCHIRTQSHLMHRRPRSHHSHQPGIPHLPCISFVSNYPTRP